ncbi:hypothetical protein [Mucilaginibacter dorajii]|uniref:Pectate lyase superfamily protein domain-containing protein n=1 Tax=Mucilaginibacter dorajii TaxID=692994 RepID=A0ABP7Q6C3_9SPHI|nr:hypothetical protein [Mucilaginibacter dorajii]MCS3737855.1 hypothetical protein [Mucilaginibacter dorajii]
MATIVTTLNGLRTFAAPPQVNDIYEITDYGTGIWYYDSTDTFSADNTGTVVVSSPYRFKRIFTEPAINITWFGAIGDGVTDCYDAIQATINYVNGNGRILIPTGVFYLNKPPLNSTSQIIGALKLPVDAKGIVISGQGKSSVIKLSANVPRAFDIPLPPNITTVYTYKNIALEKFDVDANNIDGNALGPTVTVTAVGGLVGSYYEVTVNSSAGMVGAGFVFYPYSNTGTAKAITGYYQKKIGFANVLQLMLETGVTLAVGDLIKGFCNMHVLIGTYFNSYQYNINTDNIRITDIDLLNLPPGEIPVMPYAKTQTGRQGIRINSGTPGDIGISGGYDGVVFATNILIERVRVYGGSTGIVITDASSTGISHYYIDNVTFRDCYHNTLTNYTVAAGSANFQIGNNAYGNTVLIERCTGHNSGDVGIEIDSLANGKIIDCSISNACTAGYYLVNYNKISTIPTPITTTLTTSILSTDTILTIASFPDVGSSGLLTIDSELIYYDYTDSLNLNIIRGCNGTASANHSSGAAVMFAPITTTITASVSSTDMTMTLAAFPNVESNGFLTIDNELIYYNYTGSTILNLVRGCNSTAALAHASGAIVTFIELSKQKTKLIACSYINNVPGNLSRGFSIVTALSGLYPLPPVDIENCTYTRLNSNNLGTGEAFFSLGNPDININGFDCNIKGINQEAASVSSYSSAIYISNSINATIIAQLPASNVNMRNVNIIVDGILDNWGYTRYWDIFLEKGNWHLDWTNINIKNNLLTTFTGSSGGIQSVGLVLGSNGNPNISGVIDGYKFSSSVGSASPAGIVFSSAPLFGRLLISNPDFTDLVYDNATNNDNYKPWNIDPTLATFKNVIFSNVKHSKLIALSAASQVKNRVSINSNYTVSLAEEYLGVNTISGAVGIALPSVEAGITRSKTNYGYTLIVIDETYNAAFNNITITPFAGEKINNSTSPFVLNTNGGFVTLIAIPAGWVIVTNSSVTSLADNTVNGVAITWANRKTIPTPTVVLGAITPSNITSSGQINVGTSVTNPTTGSLALSRNGGQQFWEQTTGGTDEKLWDIINAGNVFRLRAVNDVNSAATTWIQVGRSGTSINYVAFPNGPVGIGTIALAASAKVQIVSTTQGTVPMPVMTTGQKLAIVSPIDGLQVYDSTLHTPSYYNGTTWQTLITPVVEIITTSQAASVDTKYIANNAGLVVITLPTAATLGQQLHIRGKGVGGWKVAQNSGQTIHGATSTTTGTSGSIASQSQYDTVTLECIVANSDFVIVSNTGTLTIV